jgi:energy-coupling factor transporter transmembrane protein EcfT
MNLEILGFTDNKKIICWRRLIILGIFTLIFFLNLKSCKERNIMSYIVIILLFAAIIFTFLIMNNDKDSSESCNK